MYYFFEMSIEELGIPKMLGHFWEFPWEFQNNISHDWEIPNFKTLFAVPIVLNQNVCLGNSQYFYKNQKFFYRGVPLISGIAQ